MGQWILPEVGATGFLPCITDGALLSATAAKVSGIAPSPRGGLACVAIGSRIVVFGGSDRAPLTFDDLWVLDTGELWVSHETGQQGTGCTQLVQGQSQCAADHAPDACSQPRV